MAKTPYSIRRAAAILKIPNAIERGLTPSAFIRELREAGLSYRRTLMFSDWRNVLGTEARKDVIKYVRRDRHLSIRSMADVDWLMSADYMYKVKVWTRTRPDEPLQERFVNIMHDKPLSPTAIIQELYSRWSSYEKYMPEQIEKTELVGAWHKVEPLEEPTPSPFMERE